MRACVGAERGVAVRRCHVGVRGPRGGCGAGALRAGGGGGRGCARASARGRRRVGRRARPPAPVCRLRLARVSGDATFATNMFPSLLKNNCHPGFHLGLVSN